jgi:RNA polymerase sigma factor (sigma-70 family)
MAKEYFIVIDGEQVPVDEDTYYAFKRPAWAERKRRQVRVEKERSLDAFMDAGYDVPSDALVSEIVEDKLLLETLYAALAELADDERELINTLFFDEKSERDVSRETGVPRKTIAYRRNKVLEKLRKLIETM